jgi:hypothetical protein
MTFQVPYIYYYITKFCSQQAEEIQSHENANVRDVGKRNSWYSCLLEADSTPGPIMRLKGLGKLKNPVTSWGIETVTFRLVAQYQELPVMFLDFTI